MRANIFLQMLLPVEDWMGHVCLGRRKSLLSGLIGKHEVKAHACAWHMIVAECMSQRTTTL
jgi:hypothetical protein